MMPPKTISVGTSPLSYIEVGMRLRDLETGDEWAVDAISEVAGEMQAALVRPRRTVICRMLREQWTFYEELEDGD